VLQQCSRLFNDSTPTADSALRQMTYLRVTVDVTDLRISEEISRISEEEVSIVTDYTNPLFYAQVDFLQKLA